MNPNLSGKTAMENTANNGFLDLVNRRRSVRSYQHRAIERDKIERCLEASRLAPSACNSQPWVFIVVDDPSLKDKVAAAAGGGALPLNHFTRQAPVLVVVAASAGNVSARIGGAVKDKPFALMDVAIAAEHFCLQAADDGLGTCLLGWFNESRVRSLLGIPKSLRPILMLTVGYPADAPTPRRRKSIKEISVWNAFPGILPGNEPARISRRCSLAGLALWLMASFVTAAIGGWGSAQAGTFYTQLVRPAWAPPGWLFGPVWSVLYLFMGIAAWLVWRRRGFHSALILYLAQLVVNGVWTWLFFAWRLGAWAFCGILLLWFLVLGTICAFRRTSRLAALLLWPYLAWVTFATALAFAAWHLNPGLL